MKYFSLKKKKKKKIVFIVHDAVERYCSLAHCKFKVVQISSSLFLTEISLSFYSENAKEFSKASDGKSCVRFLGITVFRPDKKAYRWWFW